MTVSLAPREFELLQFIDAHLQAHGFGPSTDEMRVFMRLKSKSGIARLIDNLERAGAIRRIARLHSGIEVLIAPGHHPKGCGCDDCVTARYAAGLQLIGALRVAPDDNILRANPVGFRNPTIAKRANLLGIKFKAAPRTRAALPGGQA